MRSNLYKIEHRILTLAHCAVMDKKDKPTSFTVEDVDFSHWNFSHSDGWLTDAWIAEGRIEAENFHTAFQIFRNKLIKIIPRVSLISQSYIEFSSEPFLIKKIDNDTAFFRYVNDTGSVGLMFMESDHKALDLLLKTTEVPEEFYYYWNDAVNTIGYSPKLLLMFSAIEALAKINGKKDWNLMNLVLGKDLVEELFGTKENSSTGLRHRLVHGEYFNISDNGKNYLEIIHNKIISYFNDNILGEKLIPENVTRPQRHFFGNKEECKIFIKSKDETQSLGLKKVLESFNKSDVYNPKDYEIVFDDKLNTTY